MKSVHFLATGAHYKLMYAIHSESPEDKLKYVHKILVAGIQCIVINMS